MRLAAQDSQHMILSRCSTHYMLPCATRYHTCSDSAHDQIGLPEHCHTCRLWRKDRVHCMKPGTLAKTMSNLRPMPVLSWPARGMRSTASRRTCCSTGRSWQTRKSASRSCMLLCKLPKIKPVRLRMTATGRPGVPAGS